MHFVLLPVSLQIECIWNKKSIFLTFLAAILDFGDHVGFHHKIFVMETSNMLFLLHQNDVWVHYRPHLIVYTHKYNFPEIPKFPIGGATNQAVKSKSCAISLAIILKYTPEIHTLKKNIVATCPPKW